ncbi:MAG: glycosyltransferase [Candidatus Bathyarchaeia archaeon]
MEYVLFITHFKPCKSGYASYAYYLVNSIAKQKPDLPLVVLGCNENVDKDFTTENVRNIVVDRCWESKMFISDIFKIIYKVFKYKPSKIYVYYPLFTTFDNYLLNMFANVILLLMLTLSTPLLRAKLLIDLDNVPKPEAPPKSKIHFLTLLSPLLILYFLRDKIVIVCRNSIMEKILAKYLRNLQTKFIPHGCPAPKPILPEESSRLKNILGFSNKKVVLYLGYISRYKGVSYLIKAFAKIHKKFPQAILLIAGDYFNPLDKYRPKKHTYLPTLKKLVRDLALEERVIFHTFHIPDEYLKFYLAIADVICLPYVTSNISFSGILAIAMSYGKPVIVSNCGWFNDVIIDGENGLVVPEKDIDALAEAIALLLENDRLRLKLGSSLASKAHEFSWDNIAQLWLKLLIN